MYSPKELEGEVDHSFFDSDCDVSSTKPENPVHHDKVDRDSTNKMLPNQTERRSEQQGSEVETLEKEMFGLEVQSGLIVKDVSKYKENAEIIKNNNVDAERGEVACGNEDSDSSSRKSSPLPHSDMSDSSRGSQSDDSSSICSSSSSSSAAEEDDAVSINTDDAPNHCKNGKNPSGKFLNRSHNYSSSSSGDERSPTPQTKPSSTQSSSFPRRQPKPGSVNRKQRPKTSETSDSDDTVTDVTPLSSPPVSPQQSVKLALPTFNQSSLPVDGQHLDATTDGKKRSAVQRAGRRTNIPSPGSTSVSSSRSSASRSRKNYSFNSEEVRRIECENQRLLRVLSPSSTRASSRAIHQSSAQTFRLYHSALNRQREQERIQRENLALLKRLESIKASPGMTRLEQLTDYHRQAGYLGSPLVRPTSGKSSKIFGSTSPQRTRPETAKPTRTTTPRPAWS